MIEIWKLALTQLPEPFCSEDGVHCAGSSVNCRQKRNYSIFRARIDLHSKLRLYLVLVYNMDLVRVVQLIRIGAMTAVKRAIDIYMRRQGVN